MGGGGIRGMGVGYRVITIEREKGSYGKGKMDSGLGSLGEEN